MKKVKKDKKLSKLINNSDSESDNNSEQELSYYINDRVKLMKEVLKIIKPRKIISMAPECMRNMDKDEINSLLLEELLGISNKRLRYIFEGKNLDEESSSSDDDQIVDVISLDDVSDDDFVIISDEEQKQDINQKRKHVKDDLKRVKKEKTNKQKVNSNKNKNTQHKNKLEKEPMDQGNLMSVLELLELQARARAIRSQLELENRKKMQEQNKSKVVDDINDDDDDDDIIMEVPKEEEIVIPSSDDEINDQSEHQQKQIDETNSEQISSKDNNLIIESASKTVDESKINDNTPCKSLNMDDQSIQSDQLEDTNLEKSELIDTQCNDNISETVNDFQNNSLQEKDQNNKKFKHIINKYQSYKKEFIGDNIVMKTVHLKQKDQRKKQSIEENDDLVINIDQDDLDCIVCD